MDRRRTDGTSTSAIACMVIHSHADQALYAAGLSYYPRIKTQIKRGRPKLNWICRGLNARRGMARARRRRMALIDRETISILLYVFIISRPSRRFNIGTGTWDECRYSGTEGVGIANPCRGWGRERNRPVRGIGMDGEKEGGKRDDSTDAMSLVGVEIVQRSGVSRIIKWPSEGGTGGVRLA